MIVDMIDFQGHTLIAVTGLTDRKLRNFQLVEKWLLPLATTENPKDKNIKTDPHWMIEFSVFWTNVSTLQVECGMLTFILLHI